MDIRPISKELPQKAVLELNENPERVKDDIEHIKQWLADQPHLNARTEDQWILTFLRACKFDLDQTKEKIDMYYTARTMAPEYSATRDPFDPDIQELLKLGIMLPLRKVKAADSPRVFLVRAGIRDTAKASILKFIILNWMIFDIMFNEDDQGVIAGMVSIQDMKGLTMTHLAQMTPSIVKRTTIIFQEAMPMRPKQMHYMNLPSFFDTIYQMMKPFLKEKLQQRIVLHTKDNLESLHEYIPREILPEEYGGTGGTLQKLTDYWKEKVESYRQWFLDDQKYRTDESKRQGKSKIVDEAFGIEEFFRKLEVD